MSKEEFEPETEDHTPEKKTSQQLLLLILIILIFVYLYFFTGLIRPRPQGQPTPPPTAESNVVKKPLPPRPSEGGKVAEEVKTAAGAKEAKDAKVQPAQPAGKGEQGAKQAAPAGAKPAKPAAKAEVPPQQKEVVKHAGQPVPTAQAKGAKPAAQPTQAKGAKPAPHPVPAAQAKGVQPAAPAKEAKGAPAAEKKQLAKVTGQPAAKPSAKQAGKAAAEAKIARKEEAEQATVKQPKKVKVAVKPAYALEINGDLAESEMAPMMTRLKKAGVGHVVKTKVQKSESMHRLFLADFGNHDEAQEELDRLKMAAPSAFMLKENGRYAIYAGSYMRESKAAGEQERLLQKGVKLVVKTATVPVSVVRLHAGAFPDAAAAERAAGSLKKAGVPAKVVKAAR